MQLHVTRPAGVPMPWLYGESGTETQCTYDDPGNVTGAVTTITVTPHPDWEGWQGAPLTYTWSASNGSITASGLTATWKRPVESEPIAMIVGEATLTVSDGTGASGDGSGIIEFGACE